MAPFRGLTFQSKPICAKQLLGISSDDASVQAQHQATRLFILTFDKESQGLLHMKLDMPQPSGLQLAKDNSKSGLAESPGGRLLGKCHAFDALFTQW